MNDSRHAAGTGLGTGSVVLVVDDAGKGLATAGLALRTRKHNNKVIFGSFAMIKPYNINH